MNNIQKQEYMYLKGVVKTLTKTPEVTQKEFKKIYDMFNIFSNNIKSESLSILRVGEQFLRGTDFNYDLSLEEAKQYILNILSINEIDIPEQIAIVSAIISLVLFKKIDYKEVNRNEQN